MKDTNLIAALFLLLISCSGISTSRHVYHVDDSIINTLDSRANYIKVHLKSGKVVLLKKWALDHHNKKIVGQGVVFNVKRKQVNQSAVQITLDYDDCILIETNEYNNQEFLPTAIMVVATTISASMIPCLADPKACFGSCPTFYLHQGDSVILQAEGFSSSIIKSMEDSDIDMLSKYSYTGQPTVKVEVKNEAMETHYVRAIQLLALPNPKKGLILEGGGRFYLVDQISDKILNLTGLDPVEKTLLEKQDGLEYYSASDSFDLNTKEEIIIKFDEREASSSGVLIAKRQSLMTTFLFYQSLAYMGSKVGDIMAFYESANPLIKKAQKSIYDLLGGIEVSVWLEGRWQRIGSVTEQGPIAPDVHFLPVQGKGHFDRIKLTMTKGLWRIDQVAIGTIKERLPEPIVLNPKQLFKEDVPDPISFEQLIDSNCYLVNDPGTSYTIEFKLPADRSYSLFLKSKGYYTEWIRSEWLREEDADMTVMLLRHPQKWLKVMAPKFKAVEDQMDDLFWSSKFTQL